MESDIRQQLKRSGGAPLFAVGCSDNEKHTAISLSWKSHLLSKLGALSCTLKGVETLAMTRGAVSKIVDKLEAKGWIAIRSAPSDGRVQVLSLTQSGRRFVPVLARIADQNDERFFRCLSASERDVLAKLLVKLAECNQIRDIPVQ